jgi:malate dehydrogenase (oxaloacetate-decarboxylating)(NADP+)
MADGSIDTRTARISAEEALALHASGRPGKLETRISKPITTARDLSLAYSPGVAEPCLHIQRDAALAYDYTAKGNMVAVVSNGTAVLGLGNLGAVASKPVMEGKIALFKRFADIDGIDLEIDSENVDDVVNAVRFLAGFGGINLEDIKAPECFVIEQRLRELMDIPVFHDDQHGTAIVAAAGLINACHLTGRDLRDTKLVVNGAGAAGIACVELLKAMGMRPEHVVLCDTKGVVYQGRTDGMNQWKSGHAAATKARTLTDALDGADVFFGLSVKGAVTKDMVSRMADKPIIFAMANPDPEITPEEAREASPHAIIATGRSDYPNQVNNVLGFPYIFRGALDVRASTINEAMKIAAAEALANLAREDVPDEVHSASAGRRLTFGPDYIIPNAFDPRLISWVPPAVARAAMESGVARRPLIDLRRYARDLSGRLDPTAGALDAIMESVRTNPSRVVFAEGEEEKVVRAAVAYRNAGYGRPVLIGREDRVKATMASLGLGIVEGIEIHNARLSGANTKYVEFLYGRMQRRGFLQRDCQRLHGGDRRCRRHGDRTDPFRRGLPGRHQPCDRARRRRPRVRPHARARHAREDDLHRRHADALPAQRRGAGRDRHRCGPGRAPSGARTARGAAVARNLRRSDAAGQRADARGGDDTRPAQGGLRVRRRDEPGRGAGAVNPRAVPVLSADRRCQCAGDAGAAFGAHHIEPGAQVGWWHDHRAAADGHGAAGADHADGRVGEPDRRSGLPRRVSGGEAVAFSRLERRPPGWRRERHAPRSALWRHSAFRAARWRQVQGIARAAPAGAGSGLAALRRWETPG